MSDKYVRMKQTEPQGFAVVVRDPMDDCTYAVGPFVDQASAQQYANGSETVTGKNTTLVVEFWSPASLEFAERED
jgi:hypothetical protein